MFSLLEASKRDESGLKVAWKSCSTIKTRCACTEAIQPSMLDRLAAPTVFMQQTLVYSNTLDGNVLDSALHHAVNDFPIFGARLTQQVGAHVRGKLLSVHVGTLTTSTLRSFSPYLLPHLSYRMVSSASSTAAHPAGVFPSSKAISPTLPYSSSYSRSTATAVEQTQHEHLPHSLAQTPTMELLFSSTESSNRQTSSSSSCTHQSSQMPCLVTYQGL